MNPKRILTGATLGVFLIIGGIWILSSTLGNVRPSMYHDQTLDYWINQVNAGDVAASNQAKAILNAEIIPRLTDQMFHDTGDSKLRLALITALNRLPGVQIDFIPADSRRAGAASSIGDFGPAAQSAIPALIQAVRGGDWAVHEQALLSLGKIHREPEVVIPFLTRYLDDDDLNDEAALALAEFGSLAKPAVPKIIPLLHAPDDDAQAAAAEALKQIDPVSYTNEMNKASGK